MYIIALVYAWFINLHLGLKRKLIFPFLRECKISSRLKQFHKIKYCAKIFRTFHVHKTFNENQLTLSVFPLFEKIIQFFFAVTRASAPVLRIFLKNFPFVSHTVEKFCLLCNKLRKAPFVNFCFVYYFKPIYCTVHLSFPLSANEANIQYIDRKHHSYIWEMDIVVEDWDLLALRVCDPLKL